MGRKPVLLTREEALKYSMITRWNTVSTEYDGTPKVLAIPNYLGTINCEDQPYERDRRNVDRPTRWQQPTTTGNLLV